MIERINGAFVPVWVDVRETPLPRLPVWPQVLVNAKLGPDNRVIDLFSQGFFLRSVVLWPDGQSLLNPQAATVVGSLEVSSSRGYDAYAQEKAQDDLNMLTGAENRFERVARGGVP